MITRGATILAAVSLLNDAFPEADVCGFALIRTQSQGEVVKIAAPCLGTVMLNAWGDPVRDP